MKQNVKLIKKEMIANETMAFHFEKPDQFEFRAGQFGDITLIDPPETDDEGNTRGFSIATAPHESDIVMATRLRDTAFKRVLRELPEGSEVLLDAPYGDFTLHKAEAERGRPADMTEDEVIFYDALVENGSARDVMGDDQLRSIAKVLVEQVRRDATIDWAHRRNVQAKLRVNVKRTLAKYGYPPDQQAIATDMVLEQAKRYGNEWSEKRAAYEVGGGASLLE